MFDYKKNGDASVSLGVIQETLLIPLYCRAVETLRHDGFIIDNIAVEMVRNINYDFSKFEKDKALHLQVAIRTKVFDLAVSQFINKYPETVIVNLGAGLDTRFRRVDNQKILWFDLDMPDSMQLRKRFLPETERNRYIEKSMFDFSWIDEVTALRRTNEVPVLIVAEGLLLYFSEEENKSLFKTIADRMPHSYFLFHSTCPVVANNTSLSVSVSTTQATFKWGIRKNKEVEQWDPRYKVLDEWFFVEWKIWRWIKLGTPIYVPGYRKHYYETMKVALVRLNFDNQ